MRPSRERIAGAPLALALVLTVGFGLRLWLMLLWRPAFLGYPDAIGYIDAARLWASGLGFWNPYRPAGYPFFLALLHHVYGNLSFVVALQHAMGLLAALLLYLATSRFTRNRWVAVLPAAVVALSGSELYLEHSVLSETLYTFLVVGALWCAARSIDSGGPREVAWLAVSGALIGLSGPVRSVGIFVAPVLVLWALATRPGWRYRIACGTAVLAGFVLAFGGWLVFQHSTTKTWALTRTAGETLYARTAVFANCHSLTPPAGTRALCPAPWQARNGATWFIFDGGSPVYKTFGLPSDPRSGGSYHWAPDSKLRAFAEAAIEQQPGQYVWTTLQGLVKYVAPGLGARSMLEWTHSTLIDNLHNPQVAGNAAPELAGYYPGERLHEHNVAAPDAYARAAKVEGPVTAVLLVLMLAGFVLARGRQRTALGLFGWTTTMMMLAPVALLFYGARYATPAYGPLAAAAAFGLDELWVRRRAVTGRFRARRDTPDAATESRSAAVLP